ncbi:hypothetical protein B0H13DRAFT_2087611 [Mycena leptocephala]|nr:hypothetical protein B0H13DRAFT_2087611 [Mycena leptocephala]
MWIIYPHLDIIARARQPTREYVSSLIDIFIVVLQLYSSQCLFADASSRLVIRLYPSALSPSYYNHSRSSVDALICPGFLTYCSLLVNTFFLFTVVGGLVPRRLNRY